MRSSAAAALLPAVLILCWSSGFVGAAVGTGVAPVATVLAWRTMICAAVLAVWLRVRRRGTDWSRPQRRAILRQVVLGLLVQAVYLGGVFAAAGSGVPAGVSALVAAAQPLAVGVLAGPLLGERVTGRQRAGLLVGALGVVVVVAGDLDGAAVSPLAYLLPLVAVAGLTAGTLLERRWRPVESVTTSLALQSTVAAAVFAAVAMGRGEFVPPADPAFWAAMAWLVVLSSFGGYGSYLAIVRLRGATRASALLYLTPPTTALWAWLALGQQPPALAVPGVALCGAGVALAASWRVRPRRSSSRRRSPSPAAG